MGRRIRRGRARRRGIWAARLWEGQGGRGGDGRGHGRGDGCGGTGGGKGILGDRNVERLGAGVLQETQRWGGEGGEVWVKGGGENG